MRTRHAMKNSIRGILLALFLFPISICEAMSRLQKKILKSNHSEAVEVKVLAYKAVLTTQLFMAVMTNNETKIKALLAKGANINGRDDNGDTPLHIAWNIDCRDLINFLLEQGAAISAQDTFGMTLLHLAANIGDARFVNYLLIKGASVFVHDKEGCTPLHRAVMAGLQAVKGSKEEAQSVKTIKLLLASGKHKLFYAADSQEKTVVDYIAKQPESKVASLLKLYKEQDEARKTENLGPDN